MVAIAADPAGRGYWLVGADGGIFAFGDAPFFGSQLDPSHSVVGFAASRDRDGSWVAGADGSADGSVHGFATAAAGNASTIDALLVLPKTLGIAARTGGGYWLAHGATDPASSLANDPFLACTRAHEPNLAGGYRAVSSAGTYRGASQFDQST